MRRNLVIIIIIVVCLIIGITWTLTKNAEEKIESSKSFEIHFTVDNSLKENKIISKDEMNLYDYDIYEYNGIANVTIDGITYSLQEAIKNNKITVEEILDKAKKDEEKGNIQIEQYLDGGSIICKYPKYNIIKCNTLSGNKDLYICPSEIELDDIKIDK